MEEEAAARNPSILAFGCGTPLVLYAAAYLYARLTHELVNYGSFIAGPGAMGGIGFRPIEVFFAPLTFLEETVRFL